jgi:hypothetical protein
MTHRDVWGVDVPPPTERHTWARNSIMEGGLGSVACTSVWESDPNDEGSFARVDEAILGGQLFLTITDMEEHDGSYGSVEVTLDDLHHLRDALAPLLMRRDNGLKTRDNGLKTRGA